MNTDRSQIELVIVTDPFDASESGRIRYQLDFEAKTIAELLSEIDEEYGVYLNGELVEHDRCHKVTPAPGDFIVYTPLVARGGSNSEDRSKFRTTLQLAISVAAAAMVIASGGALWPLAMILTVGGNLVVNGVWPPIAPKNDEPESTYGVDGPQNNTKEGSPLPLIYGRHWTGGNVYDVHSENVSPTTQDLYILLGLSEGEIDGIDRITIDETDATQVSQADIDNRPGTATQTAMPWFNQVTQSISKSVTFTHGTTDLVVHTSPPGSDAIRFDISFSFGLCGRNKDNKKRETSVNLKILYREAGTLTWVNLPLRDNLAAQAQAQLVEAQALMADYVAAQTAAGPGDEYYGPKIDELQIVIDRLTAESSLANVCVRRFTGKREESLRYSVYPEAVLDPLKSYEYRMSSTTPGEQGGWSYSNELALTGAVEIINAKVSYKHTALTGLRIRMGALINRMPKILVLVRGIKVKVYDPINKTWSVQWSDNPAWIVWDILTNARYGAGRAESKMNLQSFVKWASFCESNGLKFNGVIDGQKTAWDAIRMVFKVGQAIPVYTGTTLSVSIESIKPASMMFNSASILKGSLATNWVSLNDRANEVRMTYYDVDNFNKPALVVLRDNIFTDPAVDQSKVRLQSAEIKLPGVDNRDQAARAGILALNMNKLCQSIQFETTASAMACDIGDKILVQHEMPMWSQGGLSESGSTITTLVLDREVEVSASTNSLLVKHDFDYLQSYTVSQVNGDIVYLTGFTLGTFERIDRAVNPNTGVDHQVVQQWSDLNGNGLVLEDATGLLPGAQLDLINTDVIEIRSITNAPGKTSTLTVTPGFSKIPPQYTPWVAGKMGSEAKPFVVRDIGVRNDHVRSITALEYDASIYDNATVTDVQDYSPTPSRILTVSWNGFIETGRVDGDDLITELSMSWEALEPGYKGSEVWVDINDGGYAYQGTFAKSFSLDVNDGDLVKVKVLPIDAFNRRPTLGEATIYQHVVSGVLPSAPSAPVDLVLSPRARSVQVSWQPTEVSDDGTIVRRDTPGVFRIYMAPGAATLFTDLSVELKATVTATTAYIAGLSENVNYRVWVVEVHKLFPDVRSDALVGTFVAGEDVKYTNLFPVGITHNMLAGALLTDVENTTVMQTINDLNGVVTNSLVDEQILKDWTLLQLVNQKSEINGNIAIAKDDIVTLSTDTGAVAGRVQSLETTVGGHTTSISTVSESVDGVKAQHFVNINNNGVFSGFGIMSALNQYQEVETKFIITADDFVVAKDGAAGSALVPIFGVDTQTAEVKIINAVIESQVRSSNYSPGINGFILRAADDPSATGTTLDRQTRPHLYSGYAELNNVKVRGDIEATSIGANTPIPWANITGVNIDSANIGEATIGALQLASGAAVGMQGGNSRTHLDYVSKDSGNIHYLMTLDKQVVKPNTGGLQTLAHKALIVVNCPRAYNMTGPNSHIRLRCRYSTDGVNFGSLVTLIEQDYDWGGSSRKNGILIAFHSVGVEYKKVNYYFENHYVGNDLPYTWVVLSSFNAG